MKHLDTVEAAQSAVAAHPERPASAVIHDSPDARLVVFRIAPGQEVTPHRSKSSVTLIVLKGSGVISGDGEEARCRRGHVVTYEPNELHGMKADTEELLLLATISPRPGSR